MHANHRNTIITYAKKTTIFIMSENTQKHPKYYLDTPGIGLKTKNLENQGFKIL